MRPTSEFPFQRLSPALQPLGFVVSEPLAGTPFRRRRLDIENFVSLAGVVGRKGWLQLPCFRYFARFSIGKR